MLLTYNNLVDLVARGTLAPVAPEHLNAASIDLTLGPVLHVEAENPQWEEWPDPIDLAAKQSIHTREVVMDEDGYVLEPGEFILASTVEVFHLPAGEPSQPHLEFIPALAAEYKLKSTLARNALGHLLAGWCDPGWSGSVLTLELKNESRYHHLRIRPGMKIGQVVLWAGVPVPDHASYATKGRYNGDLTTTTSKGLK